MALALGGLAGCGGDEPVTDEVRSAAEGFGEATAKKDVQRICDDLLARQFVQRVESVGLPCEVAWRKGLEGVDGATLKVRSVVVNKDQALVEVDTSAKGQKAARETLALVREQGSWRISSTAKAQPQPQRSAP